MSARSYPLQWPKGWPRTESGKRKSGTRFKNVTLAGALSGLQEEIRRLGGKSLVLSSNYTLGSTNPKEPGVVAYFDYGGKPVAMPCDYWNRLEANVRAIALTIEAMRGMERWGAKHMITAMFAGFTALPARSGPSCWEVLGLKSDPLPTEKEVMAAYRNKAQTVHPDKGGSTDEFNDLSNAKDIALATIKSS
jgi:hypothetical protein